MFMRAQDGSHGGQEVGKGGFVSSNFRKMQCFQALCHTVSNNWINPTKESNTTNRLCVEQSYPTCTHRITTNHVKFNYYITTKNT